MKRSPAPQRRTPLPRGSTPIARATRLSPRSKRREEEAAERFIVRGLVLARDRYCVAEQLVPAVACGGPLDVDEIVGRGAGGDYLDVNNCQALCRRHHEWKHEHPADAHALGLTRFSWEGPPER